MPSPDTPVPSPSALASASRRWDEMLCGLAGLIPAGPVSVLIDGGGGQPAALAARLAATLTASGRPCVRLTGMDDAGTGGDAVEGAVRLAGGPGWRGARTWDVMIWVRAGRDPDGAGENGADIVIDLYDQDWPVIRRVAASLAGRGSWYLTETRAFFSPKAATWDTRFGDDMPAYAAAVARAGIRRGGVAIDVGCGTGRALPALRQAVGSHGAVIAADVTPAMLAQARPQAAAARAALVLADARKLPFADASADALFAAGDQPPARPRSRARRTRPRHPHRWPAHPVPPLGAGGARRPPRPDADAGRAAVRRPAAEVDNSHGMAASRLRRRGGPLLRARRPLLARPGCVPRLRARSARFRVRFIPILWYLSRPKWSRAHDLGPRACL